MLLVYRICEPAPLDTPRLPGLHPLLVLFDALAAVEFREGEGPWLSSTCRTQQGGCREEIFNHPVSLSLFFHNLLPLLLPRCFPPYITYCLESSFTSFTSCNSKCREVMEGHPHTCYTHTGKHASMKARPLKALRQQKQQAVVCGLIALTGCRIIELDMSDRSVSGTKCTNEFPAALTMALIYRLFWSFPLCFTAQ